MAEKWTPGPWTAEPKYGVDNEFCFFSVQPSGGFRGTVAHVFPSELIDGITREEAEANAGLIKVAPEIAEALLTLRDYLSDIAAGCLWAEDGDKLIRIRSESVEEDLARIDAALAKARGEQ